MPVRSKTVQLKLSDGAKSLGELIGVSESWTHVFLTPKYLTGNSGNLYIGDSTLTSTNKGFSLSNVPLKEFIFLTTDNPADQLFLFADGSDYLEIWIFVY